MKVLFSLLSLLLIFSCGNFSLETDSIEVEAVENGRVLTSGDFFDITFNKTRESVLVSPTSANVNISYVEDAHNGRISSVVEPLIFTIDLQENPNPRFQITDDFREGLYTINIVVYENDSLITEHTSEFIVYSGNLSGEVSALYPLDNIYTESKIILESKISNDDYIDPYLVWTYNGVIISEGYLSDGYNTIFWDTESRYGFMDINLNLYPYKVSDPSVKSESIVDFSFIVNPLESNLYDSNILSHYHKLLYFNGNYIDEVDRYLGIDTFEESKPLIVNQFYGMEIGKTFGFSTGDSMFPTNLDNDTLNSFSLILDFMPLDLIDGTLINSTIGELSSKVFVENGILKHRFGADEYNTVEIDNVGVDLGMKLVISFVVSETGYKILYYLDGSYIKSSDWIINDFNTHLIDDGLYNFQVGGGGDDLGFSAILSSLSIYYRDDLGKNNIYPNNMKDEIGHSTYKLINSFNSVYTPINFVGNGSIDGEILYMTPTSYLSYIDVLPINKDYIIKIEGSGLYTLNFYNDGDTYQKVISNSCIVKKRGNTLFVNDVMISDWDNTKNSFSITAQEETNLDYITIESLERVFEN